jgi:hypothetical protein
LDYNNNKNKQEAKIETAEMECLRSVVGYTGKGQIGNTTISEELTIFSIYNKVLKSRSQ